MTRVYAPAPLGERVSVSRRAGQGVGRSQNHATLVAALGNHKGCPYGSFSTGNPEPIQPRQPPSTETTLR
jgi:hypothetical protein